MYANYNFKRKPFNDLSEKEVSIDSPSQVTHSTNIESLVKEMLVKM